MGYVIIIIGAVVCAIINWFWKDPIIIAGTAVTGSYLFVAGIGFFAGGFPSLYDLYHMIQNGSYEVQIGYDPVADLRNLRVLDRNNRHVRPWYLRPVQAQTKR